MVLMLIGVFAALATAHFYSATISLRQSKSQIDVQSANLEAESGVEFFIHVLGDDTIPGDVTGADLLAEVESNLSAALDGTATLGGQTVQSENGQIVVPSISSGSLDRDFSATVSLKGTDTVTLTVTGRAGNVSRTVTMDFEAVRQSNPVFDYGIAAQGPIALENTISIVGANDPSEADLYSAWSGTAFRLEDNLTIEGEVFAGDSAASVIVQGTGTISGASMADPEVMDHVYTGVGDTQFPPIDISPFAPQATSMVDAGTDTSSGTFENIRIVSGTNPTFGSGTQINGVVYIEAGNQVTFMANSTVTGVIVTEDGDGATDQIKFEDNTQFCGVEQLPDTSQWRSLRESSGTFMLAPGFHVKFENQSGAFSGIMAADHFKFENAFVGTIKGGIISYGTEEMKAEDGSSFTIDASGYGDTAPPGFTVDKRLCPQPTTYSES
jgi:hypothetical protein